MTSDVTTTHRISVVDGVRIVSERTPSATSVSVAVWIGVGSRDERAGEQGYAHFAEHLLFKGNERWTAADINRWFDGIGSDANAATTREYTVVHSRVLERHLGDTLEMFGELVWHPEFTDVSVDSERDVILEEIAMYGDSPSDLVHELADSLLFADHGLGVPIVGSERSIRDARAESLRAFHERWYRPEQLVVSAAGAVDHDDLVSLVRDRFMARAVSVASPAQDSGLVVPRVRPRAHVGSRVVAKESEQVHLCLTWPGLPRRDDRRFAAAVLDTVFGATPGSRLFVNVREDRGLAYSVYSFASQYADAGQVGLYLAVRPDRVHEALTVIRSELDRIRTSPISDDELLRAQRHLEGRTLLSMESSGVRGNRLGASLVTGVPIEPIESTIDRIHAVSAAEIEQLAAELFMSDAMCCAGVAEHPEPIAAMIAEALGVDVQTGTHDAAVPA